MHSLRPDLEFFVNNHRDIAAVLEIREQATKELPGQLATLLLEEIKEDSAKKENGWTGIPNFYAVITEGGDICWSDSESLWDRKKEYGMHFGLGPFSEDAILNAGGPQDGPFLYLYVDAVGNKAQKKTMVDAIRKVISANKGSLQIPGVSFGPLLDDEEYLAHQPMFDLLTLDTLHKDDRGHTIEQIVERARRFSETIAPVLPQLSSLAVASARHRGKRSSFYRPLLARWVTSVRRGWDRFFVQHKGLRMPPMKSVSRGWRMLSARAPAHTANDRFGSQNEPSGAAYLPR
jgi:hypothetical protein